MKKFEILRQLSKRNQHKVNRCHYKTGTNKFSCGTKGCRSGTFSVAVWVAAVLWHRFDPWPQSKKKKKNGTNKIVPLRAGTNFQFVKKMACLQNTIKWSTIKHMPVHNWKGIFYWPHPWYAEVPRSGIKPAPQQLKCWILNLLNHQGTWKGFFFFPQGPHP